MYSKIKIQPSPCGLACRLKSLTNVCRDFQSDLAVRGAAWLGNVRATQSGRGDGSCDEWCILWEEKRSHLWFLGTEKSRIGNRKYFQRRVKLRNNYQLLVKFEIWPFVVKFVVWDLFLKTHPSKKIFVGKLQKVLLQNTQYKSKGFCS